MPITLGPITRRQFVNQTGVVGGVALVTSNACVCADSGGVEFDHNRVVLLADTHISDDPVRSFPGTEWPGSPVAEGDHESVNMAECLEKAVSRIIMLAPRPAHLIFNGDCTFSSGTKAEYREFLRLVEPLRAAGITVHVTIGNHDNRENLWKTLGFLQKEQMGLQAEVIELEHANLLLLDSGRKGILGEKQLDWLGKQMDQRADKPALVFGHFNPFPNRGVRPIKGMQDGASLLKLLAERKHASAYVYGHTHEWQYAQIGRLHLINQPAVSYYFGKGLAHGWVDMRLTDGAAKLLLHCIDRNHRQHGDRRVIKLRS